MKVKNRSELHRYSRVKIFTHSDLDGYGCMILSKLAFLNVDVEIVQTPADATEKIGLFLANDTHLFYSKIFITDISISDSLAMKIDDEMRKRNMRNLFTLLDHHKSAEYLNTYDWASVIVKDCKGQLESGTSLFYKYLVRNSLFNSSDLNYTPITQFTELVRSYDTWDWSRTNNQRAKDLNDLFFLIGSKNFVNQCIDKFYLKYFTYKHGVWLDIFSNTDKLLLDIEHERIDRYIKSKKKQLKKMQISNYNVGLLYAEQYISELGNIICELNDDIDFVAMVDYGKGKISLRSATGKADVSEIAKKFGGGGHYHASGFMLTDKTVKKIHETMSVSMRERITTFVKSLFAKGVSKQH